MNEMKMKKMRKGRRKARLCTWYFIADNKPRGALFKFEKERMKKNERMKEGKKRKKKKEKRKKKKEKRKRERKREMELEKLISHLLTASSDKKIAAYTLFLTALSAEAKTSTPEIGDFYPLLTGALNLESKKKEELFGLLGMIFGPPPAGWILSFYLSFFLYF